ncbi:MAG: hypothetical protein RLZ55_1701 [Actinomycetota bacterium]
MSDQIDQARDHGVKAWIDGIGAVLVGVLSVVQARINGELALQVGSGTEAAVISFATGLLMIAVIVAVVPSGRRGAARVGQALRGTPRTPLWTFLGGLGGATFVASQGLVVPATGVALFTVAVVAGLTANSLVADRLGVGPGGPRPVTWPRVAAAAIAVAGVVLAVSGQFGHGEVHIALLTLAFLAGAAVALQQGVNGRVAVIAGSPLPAALVNFVVGFTALLLIASVIEAGDGQPLVLPPALWDQPVLWLGGPIGVAFVVVAAFAVRGLGVLVFSLLTIVGQLVGGVAVDVLAPVPGHIGVTAQTLAAVLLSIGATLLAFLGGRRRLAH